MTIDESTGDPLADALYLELNKVRAENHRLRAENLELRAAVTNGTVHQRKLRCGNCGHVEMFLGRFSPNDAHIQCSHCLKIDWHDPETGDGNG